MTNTLEQRKQGNLGEHLLAELGQGSHLQLGLKRTANASIKSLVNQDGLTSYIRALLINNPEIFDTVKALKSLEKKEREHAQDVIKNHYYDFLNTISLLKGTPLYDQMTLETFIHGFYQ